MKRTYTRYFGLLSEDLLEAAKSKLVSGDTAAVMDALCWGVIEIKELKREIEKFDLLIEHLEELWRNQKLNEK